jgi:5-methylcytosine-specific restriction enzyme A
MSSKPTVLWDTLEWKRLRARFRRANPHCIACGQPTRHVDHIVPARLAPHHALDWSNLAPYCHSCHSRKTMLYDRGRPTKARLSSCNAQGYPTDPDHPWNQSR